MKPLRQIVATVLVLAAVAPAQPAAPNAPSDTQYQARVESLEKEKITLTAYRQGDSIDKPSGKRAELLIDDKTQFLDIRAREITDEETKQKLLGKGQVVGVTVEVRDGKEYALRLQAIGG